MRVGKQTHGIVETGILMPLPYLNIHFAVRLPRILGWQKRECDCAFAIRVLLYETKQQHVPLVKMNEYVAYILVAAPMSLFLLLVVRKIERSIHLAVRHFVNQIHQI